MIHDGYLNNLNFDGIKFGVEIEAFGIPAGHLISALKRNNIGVLKIHSHESSDNSVWNVGYDGSIIGSYRFELMSPILYGADGVKELIKVYEILNEFPKFNVNSTCGLHVHFDASKLNGLEIFSIYDRYRKLEKQIDMLIDEDRRGDENSFTSPLAKIDLTRYERNNLKHGGSTYKFVRNCKLNITSILKHGTLEFRQHEATKDINKVVHWIAFCWQFINYTKNLHQVSRAKVQKFETELIKIPTKTAIKNLKHWKLVELVNTLINSDKKQTIKQLAKKLNLAPSTTYNYISKLRKSGIKVGVNQKAKSCPKSTIKTTKTRVVKDSIWKGISTNIRSFFTYYNFQERA